jgi:urocanate hydratase
MGGSQPLAGRMAGAAILTVDIDPERARKRKEIGYLEVIAPDLDSALEMIALQRPSVARCRSASSAMPPISIRRSPGAASSRCGDRPDRGPRSRLRLCASDPSLDEARAMRKTAPEQLMAESRASIVDHVRAMLTFQARGAEVFDNGNLIRTHAKEGGVENAFDIPIFTEAYLRPLFARAIGPFRWMALSGDPDDIRAIDDLVLSLFGDNQIVSNWIKLARQYVPFEGLPARIAWLGHGERSELALGVNELVANGTLKGPVAFSRDHLDAAGMAHPNIMTENMRDGSDAIADWPLLDAMALCSSQADLVAVHSGGGGYAGYMTSAGVTLIADGTAAAAERLAMSLDNDTGLGVIRYADAGYGEAIDEVSLKHIPHIQL